MALDFNDILNLAHHRQNQYAHEFKPSLAGLLMIASDFIISAEHAYDIYTSHHHIQLYITKHDRTEGWDVLIPNLKALVQTEDSTVRLVNIKTERFGYLLFVRSDLALIHGVLKFKDQKVDPFVELKDTLHLRGTWTDPTIQFYFKGKLIK